MGCLYSGGTTTSCTQKCGATDMNTNQVVDCAALQCAGQCP
jgi:hypothetical protein